MLAVFRTVPGTLFLSFLLSSVLLKPSQGFLEPGESHLEEQQWHLQYSLKLPVRCSEVMPGWGGHRYKQGGQRCLWQLRGVGRKRRGSFSQNVVSDAFTSSWN